MQLSIILGRNSAFVLFHENCIYPKQIEITDTKAATEAFQFTENMHGRSWGEWTKRTAGSKGVLVLVAFSIQCMLFLEAA